MANNIKGNGYKGTNHKDGCTRSESANKYFNGIDTSLLDNMYLKHFVVWYLQGAKKDEFKKFGTLSDDYDWSMANYLARPDVQRCIVEYVKRQKEMNLVKIYNKMMDNALNGDVQSANWIATFSKSDFFENKANELEGFINGLSTDE